jgi:hypothetical protein
VNSCLYSNIGKHFLKQGETPPLWRCISSSSGQDEPAHSETVDQVPIVGPDLFVDSPSTDSQVGQEPEIRNMTVEGRSDTNTYTPVFSKTQSKPTEPKSQHMTILGRTDYYGFTDNEDDEDLTDLV